MSKLAPILFVLYCLVMASTQAVADKLVIRFFDPQGDNSGRVDVSSMEVRFNSVSGFYAIYVRADLATPFTKKCSVNVNIWNPDAGTFFQDTWRGFDNLRLRCPRNSTIFTLSGINFGLIAWEANDRVATSSRTVLGDPPGTSLFRSSVADWVDGGFVNCGFGFPNICDEDAISAQEVFLVEREVPIDIRPHSLTNKIYPNSIGSVWVAMMSSTESSFDPLQSDIDTLRFGPARTQPITHHVKDLNGDGLGDLVLRFDNTATGISCLDPEALLSGMTYSGVSFRGADFVTPKGRSCNRREVSIDIKPNLSTNRITLFHDTTLYVAVLSDAASQFAPNEINVSSVRFGPGRVAAHGSHTKDFNGDGIKDLVLHFDNIAARIGCEYPEATLFANMLDGDEIIGRDFVKTIGCL